MIYETNPVNSALMGTIHQTLVKTYFVVGSVRVPLYHAVPLRVEQQDSEGDEQVTKWSPRLHSILEDAAYYAVREHKRTTAQRRQRKLQAQQVVFDSSVTPKNSEEEKPLGFGADDVQANYFDFPSLPMGTRRLVANYQALFSTRRANSLVGKYCDLDVETDALCNILEVTLVFQYQFWCAKTTADRLLAVVTMAKMSNSRLDEFSLGLTGYLAAFHYFFTPEELEVQSNTPVFLESFQSFMDKFDLVRNAPIFTKLYKFSMYVLSTSMLAPLGIDMDLLKFDELAQEAMKAKYHLGVDFIHCMLDTLLFVCQRGHQCLAQGSLMPIFHTEQKYQEWYDLAERLTRQAHFLSNPEAHGIDRFSFLADVKDAIEKGHSMRRCITRSSEKLVINRLLASLEFTHDMEFTKRAAQRARPSPAAYLLFGGSGIGKSTLQNLMRIHAAKVLGLNQGSEFCYVRNATEEFWSGFNSTMWCVILDDIAFLSPNLGVLDPSMAEMLCILNNVPFVPAQADLADKGRTPVRAKLVIGSTNTEHLNAHAQFSCPLAVQRRFPWIIDVTVKDCYQGEQKGMLDSKKVPAPAPGSYPDLWNFTIKTVKPASDSRLNQRGVPVVYAEYDNMRDFLVWYSTTLLDHERVQAQILAGNDCMESVVLCDECRLPQSMCDCDAPHRFTKEQLSFLGDQGDYTVEDVPDLESDDEDQVSTGTNYESDVESLFAQANVYEIDDDVEEAEEPLYRRREMPMYYQYEPIDMTEPVCERSDFAVYASTLPLYDWTINWYYALWYRVSTWLVLNFVLQCIYGENWYVDMLCRSPHKLKLLRTAVALTGRRVERSFPYWKAAAAVAASVTAVLALYKTNKWLFSAVLCPQGNLASFPGEAPTREPVVVPTSRPSVSYVSATPYSSADLSQHTLAAQPKDKHILESNIENAAVRFKSKQGGVVRETSAMCVRGNVYMCNNHAIPPSGDFMLEILAVPQRHLCANMTNVLVTDSMVYRLADVDLAFIQLRIRPPGVNLTPYFANPDYTGWLNGEYIGRTAEGTIFRNTVSNLKKEELAWPSHGKTVKANTWFGKAQVATEKGECGTCLLSYTPAGPVILGIHTLGRGSQSAAVFVSRKDVVRACDALDAHPVCRGSVTISAPSCTRTLGDLRAQSLTLRANPGVCNVIGSFQNEFIMRSRSNVGGTFIQDAVVRAGYPIERTAPPMNEKSWVLALNDMTRPVTLMREDVLREATSMFIRETQLASVENVHVLSLHVAINGSPGVTYCDKLNRSSSAGAPYKRGKKQFMYFLEAGGTDMDVVDEIKDTIRDMITAYESGERVHAVYVGHRKDEPITFEKAIAGKVRVFTASSLAYSLVVRKYLLSVIMHMQHNRYVYETAPGTIPQSLEWDELMQFVTKHGTETLIAGDYSKFDKRMPANVILAAFDIIIEMCQRAGYSDLEIKVVRGIAYDTAFPTVDFNGDLVEFFGSNPSGHPLTVIVNGLANSLYIRYCWIVLRPVSSCKFKENVNLMTYGDDNIMGVHPNEPWFNHTSIQKVLADIDIGYTMADKEAESVPYVNLTQVNFLKRAWRWDEDIGAHVAPLDHSSIAKMLTVCTRSNNVTPEAHAMNVIQTAVREYFWYGREVFEQKRELFQSIVVECELQDYVEAATFPEWSELYMAFWTSSRHVKCFNKMLPAALKKQFEVGLASPLVLTVATQQTVKEADREIGQSCPDVLERPVDGEPIVRPLPECKVNCACVKCFMIGCETQADVMVTEATQGAHLQRETVAFHDEAAGMHAGLNLGYDGISAMDQTQNIDFVNFLSRPVRIASFTWNESDAVGTTTTVNPWQAYFTDARVQYKLNNFAFIQCKLKVKVLVNASPFYYGSMIMAYQPLPAFTPSTIQIDAGTRYFIPTSQRPHLWIYPQGNEGGEMTLPYFNPKNWLNAQSSTEMLNMGQLKFTNYTTLQSANGAAGTGVTISVYAYAEDVKLSGPSVGLATQSWEVQSDEYGNGVISAPATAIANGAKWFEDIPIIGRFATATRIGASAVSTIASMFGFTNVPVIADTQPYRPEPFPKFASSEIGYPVEKLTLDPKNELTVDPSVLGLEAKDEMIISHLAQRESYLATATWNSSDASDKILFSANVNPFQFDNDAAANSKLYMTPMGWIAALFEHWRGDIIFRFKVIASPFHKGRLRISFDPSGYTATNLINQTATNNVVFTEIVDLGENADVEFRVPYQQATAFLVTRNDFTSGGIQWSTSATPSFAYSPTYDNGTISVRVLTALTAPLASSSVSILVFARAANNFEVANPRTVPDASTFQVQSSEYTESDFTTTQVLGTEKRDPHADRYLVNFGESIKSLRQLMRRTSLIGVTTFTTDTTNDLVINRKRFLKIPPDYGYDTNGIHSAKGILVPASNFAFNFVNKTPLTWIMPAFLAYRGSTIWTFNTCNKLETNHVRVWRSNQAGVPAVENVVAAAKGTVSANARFYKLNSDSGAAGQAVTNQWTNAGLSVLCPNYGRYRFQSTTLQSGTLPSGQDDSQFDEFVLEVSSDGVSGPDNKGLKVWSYNSIGTDFGLYFFLNVPTLWLYTTLPTAN
nr:MAG: hypothetical protein [Marnaviridae sp.]